MELLAPAGSLETALVALEAGADAVYLGLRKFSARSAATNLDPIELRRAVAAARQRKRRIFLAVNTIVTQAEWPELRQVVYTAVDSGVDALIVQDWGVLSWVRRHLPHLAVHASTQMSVHNAPGARFLQDLGVTRVVLARELSLAEIRTVALAVPGMEIEVFVHGALCYGASGLCLASGSLLGRSANRGECAQICRTWFEGDEGKEFTLSTRDLRLGPGVLRLAESGVTSLKIEGRMKGPAYVDATVRWYRSILDGKPDTRADEASRLAFARPSTQGFLDDPRGTQLLATDYPGHRGVALGPVVARRGRWCEVALLHDLEIRDGVLTGTVPAAVRGLRLGGKPVFEAKAGQSVEVEIDPAPTVGAELRLLHHGPGPRFSPTVPEPWQTPLHLRLVVSPGSVAWQAGGFAGGGVVEGHSDLPLQAARNAHLWTQALEAGLGVGGAGPKEQAFHLASVVWDNQTGWPGVFIPPSAWKAFKRSLWEVLGSGPPGRHSPGLSAEAPLPPPFVAAETWAPSRWPDFATPLQAMSEVTVLLPLQFDPARELEPIVDKLQTQTQPFLLVLNNAGHFPAALKLAQNPAAHFAFGYGFHAANQAAVAFLAASLPRVTAVCAWQEGGGVVAGWGTDLVIPPSAQVRAPDFLSRFCVRKHAWGGDCRDCGGNWEAQRVQNGQKWTLKAQRCLTVIRRQT